jgi:5'-nucleotidase
LTVTQPHTAPWVLITNDDGVDSPALLPLVRELSAIATVCTVVPATECSWTGKIMSRFGELRTATHPCGEFEVCAVNGYPADCANLGIHTLFETPPALVVSGINMGTNAGLAYMLSSGTVGAAMEAMLGGIPATAFSLELEAADYDRWRHGRALTDQVRCLLDNAAAVTRHIVQEVLCAGLPGDASLLTVNMPSSTRVDSPRRLARVTRTGYGAYFAAGDDGRYRFSFSGLKTHGPAKGGDLAALACGEVALTPIRFALDADVSAADRQRFELPG